MEYIGAQDHGAFETSSITLAQLLLGVHLEMSIINKELLHPPTTWQWHATLALFGLTQKEGKEKIKTEIKYKK